MGAFLGDGAGVRASGEVDEGAAVAVEDGDFEHAAGKGVEGGAVAGDVAAPGLPVGVAFELDAFAEDEAGGLAGEALEEGGEGGVEDAALVGGVVFAGFAGDETLGLVAEGSRSTEADVDGVPAGDHGVDRVGQFAGIFAGALDGGASVARKVAAGVGAVIDHGRFALLCYPSLPFGVSRLKLCPSGSV